MTSWFEQSKSYMIEDVYTMAEKLASVEAPEVESN